MFPAASPEADAPPAARGITADAVAAAIVVLAYAAAQVWLFAGHVPWRDEAQAWLWAGALATPYEFFVVPGEGHPPLWFWLLRGLSGVLDFDQARYLTLGIALLNAVLLQRLLRGQVLVLALLLGTYSLMQHWGYHFRPYSLVLTLVIGALLCDRAGQRVAGTWLLALACGLHFFAGLFFGFWLLVQWHRGLPLRHLAGPALLAAFFGLTAILSGLGNQDGTPSTLTLFDSIAFGLAWPLPWPDLRTPLTALLVMALICIGLWREKFMLGTVLALLLAFSLGTALLFSPRPWHSAFPMVLLVMAFALAGGKARRWVLPVLLAPQALTGLVVGADNILSPASAQPDIYETIRQDAGPAFDPAARLVAWPDFMLTAAAARHGITYRGGNGGKLLGPLNWRDYAQDRVDPILTTQATPYWLVCADCGPALSAIDAAGLRALELANADNFDGKVFAYRIEAPNAGQISSGLLTP